MSELKMPERQPSDGPVEVNRPFAGRISIQACTNGVPGDIEVSDYNAWRIFGMLSRILGIPLPPKTGKAIKL